MDISNLKFIPYLENWYTIFNEFSTLLDFNLKKGRCQSLGSGFDPRRPGYTRAYVGQLFHLVP